MILFPKKTTKGPKKTTKGLFIFYSRLELSRIRTKNLWRKVQRKKI